MFDMSEEMKETIDLYLRNGWDLIHYSKDMAYIARYSTGLIGIGRDVPTGESNAAIFAFTDVRKLRAVLDLYECEAQSREG